MKKQILLLLCIGILFSCSNEEEKSSESTVIGTWKLIEVNADPGDGSGTFRAIESNKTIEFKSNGIITTNSSLCDPYSEEIKSSGSYSLANNSITTNCQNPNIATISFELEDEYLILNFISNEGYSQKFKRVN
ncbi:lipocalin family protein [Flavobacterium sp. DG2-3]|uniref:lipocalin family protein n=1 Tax=Flavobacterium sp. DG2-3 TaxID=3068317 RepID=UPI00273E50D0|nr:lipocalin family protein [Flavobacterium sp. DG2-3]MDP5200887.1 lipocalin family protein [Flavobacterium sp. DG2-3]